MSCRQLLYLFTCGVVSVAGSVMAQSPGRAGYDIDYIGPPLADPVLQHSKETYVLFGCSYCHGLNLVARGEATDLMHSRLVGRDENGKLIGPLLRAGIPQTAKLSPMPQFSDLSDQQIADLVRWIHYARQQGRYKELMEAKDSGAGNAASGKAYFDQTCGSCHSTKGDLANLAKKYDSTALRVQILHPKRLDAAPSWRLDRLNDGKTAAARQRHLALLENFSAEEVANLMAFFQSAK
jgi:mono/diheme cytochrome c family protein